jgi:hypothetical protein
VLVALAEIMEVEVAELEWQLYPSALMIFVRMEVAVDSMGKMEKALKILLFATVKP